jgi:hypothetical protein
MIKYEHFTGYTKWFNLHLVLQRAISAVAIQSPRLGAMVVSPPYLALSCREGIAFGYPVNTGNNNRSNNIVIIIVIIIIIIIPFWVGINTLFLLTRRCPNILAPPKMTSLL